MVGAQLPRIYAVVAFHGQAYSGGTYPWVDGNDASGRNHCACVMNCNTGSDSMPETMFWYPGQFTNQEVANLPPWVQIMTEFVNYLIAQGLLTMDTFMEQTQGQLGLSNPDACSRQYFNWGTYRSSRQFGLNGAPPPGGHGGNPPPSGGDNEQDNYGV